MHFGLHPECKFSLSNFKRNLHQHHYKRQQKSIQWKIFHTEKWLLSVFTNMHRGSLLYNQPETRPIWRWQLWQCGAWPELFHTPGYMTKELSIVEWWGESQRSCFSATMSTTDFILKVTQDLKRPTVSLSHKSLLQHKTWAFAARYSHWYCFLKQHCSYHSEV